MSPLEQLFRQEIEYHRRLRTLAPGTGDAHSVDASNALQAGYDRHLRSLGTVTDREVETLRERLTLEGDARDLLAARDSLKRLLGLRLLEP